MAAIAAIIPLRISALGPTGLSLDNAPKQLQPPVAPCRIVVIKSKENPTIKIKAAIAAPNAVAFIRSSTPTAISSGATATAIIGTSRAGTPRLGNAAENSRRPLTLASPAVKNTAPRTNRKMTVNTLTSNNI